MTFLPALVARRDDMVEAVAALVEVESPSSDPAAVARCGEVLSELAQRLIGTAPRHIEVDGRTHLRWTFGRPRVLLLGHLDTVWPMGTLARWPFRIKDDVASGPGIFDMKAGLIQGLFALSVLDDLDGVEILVTADEELGSVTSRVLIEEAAKEVQACLVFEPSAAGALKVGRKGVSTYRLRVHGRAAHAGLEPERGSNALIELAHQVLAMAAVADPAAGTTVTPSVAHAGTAINVVPAEAEAQVDVRVASISEQERVDHEIHRLRSIIPGTTLDLDGGPNRPPLEPTMAQALFARALHVADELGLGGLESTHVGGASDGNFTAGIGVPTLDGLGGVGDGAHAEGEHILVSSMPERAALAAGLIADLLDPRRTATPEVPSRA